MDIYPPHCEPVALALTSEAAAGAGVHCPLWPALLNRWILRRTLRGRPSNEEIISGLGLALGVWFEPRRAWGIAGLTGSVTAIARRRALELAGQIGASARQVVPAPTMAGDSFASVAFEFLYGGSARSLPWPSLGLDGRWTASDCLWAAELVGVPQ